jgi:hypothetical protein
MQKMMYLLVSQHVSGIIMLIIRRMVQNQQRLWCTALALLQKTRGEEVVGVHLLGMVSRLIIVPSRAYYSNLYHLICVLKNLKFSDRRILWQKLQP